MKDSRLSVEYSVARYNSDGRLLPDSPLNQIYAMEGLFAHISAVGNLLELVDEEKLEKMNANTRALMIENLGSFCTAIGDAGFDLLLQQEWSELFTIEEPTEAEQPPEDEETKRAAQTVAA